MTPAEKRSLAFILASVVLWFMGYNAVTTAFSKYAMQVLSVAETAAANCVLVATVVAIISYWPVGILSSRYGRKMLILAGVAMLIISFLAGAIGQGGFAYIVQTGAGETLVRLSPVAYVIFLLVGVGWASISVNSYPMVVELATGADVGKYTGYYYTFSMAAQIATPILSGWLLEHVGYHTLFPYAAFMACAAFATMLFVQHGDSRPEVKTGLEALNVED